MLAEVAYEIESCVGGRILLKALSTTYTVSWWRTHRKEHTETVSHEKSCLSME